MSRRLGILVAVALAVAVAIPTTVSAAKADTFPDAYTQIVDHQIPVQPDGSPTYIPGGVGRYYVGPNGLEIRLTSEGTWDTLTGIYGASSLLANFAVSGVIADMAGFALTSIPKSQISTALGSIGALSGPFVGSAAQHSALGNYCLGVTVPPDGLNTSLNRLVELIAGQWVQAFQGPYYNDVKVWLEQCPQHQASAVQSDALLTQSAPLLFPVAPAQPVSYLADRTILQGSDGSLWVMAGGAKFQFGSMSEFSSLGYSTTGMVQVSTDTLAAIPNVPLNGTVLRSGGGQLYVVAGGAKFQFGSMTEYYNQGYVNNQWINVPQAPLDQIGDAPDNIPANGTIIQHPNGSLYIVVGGVKFQFGSMSEFSSLGYSTSQIVRVTGAPTDGIPAASTATPPVNGTVLRSSGGQIYVVSGGAKFHFGSLAEFTGEGYPSNAWFNVPQAPLDQIGDAPGNMPRNGTVLLRPDGALFVIAGGVRWQFGSMDEFSSEGYTTFTQAPQAAVDGIYDASASHLPADGTVVQGTDSTIWLMQAGVRRSFTSMTQFTSMGYTTANIVRVPDAVLSGIPSGGNLP